MPAHRQNAKPANADTLRTVYPGVPLTNAHNRWSAARGAAWGAGSGALLLLLLTACAAGRTALNSEMIAENFGSYGLTVISQTRDRRVSNLYSGFGASRVTRTLAVVQFSEPLSEELRQPHEKILQGESLGATLSEAGWRVDKASLWLGAINANARLAEMMHIAGGTELAVHLYTLSAVHGDQRALLDRDADHDLGH